MSHGPETVWSTAEYIPHPGEHWTTLAPGLEFQAGGSIYEHKILVRQSTTYRTEHVAEPIWGKTKWISLNERFHNVIVAPAPSGQYDGRGRPSQRTGCIVVKTACDVHHYPGTYPNCACYQSQSGPIDIGESGHTWVRIAPNVRVIGSWSCVGVQYGTDEPVVTPPLWQPPFRITASGNWTYLDSGRVRLRTVNSQRGDVQVEARTASHTWLEVGIYWSHGGVTTEPIPGLRLTLSQRDTPQFLSIDRQIDVQYVVTDQEAGTDWSETFLVPMPSQADSIVPGLTVLSDKRVTVWKPNLGVSDAGLGSTAFGGWDYAYTTNTDGWTEVHLTTGPIATVRFRTSTRFNGVLEVATLTRQPALVE
jgi:hypothetical protein